MVLFPGREETRKTDWKGSVLWNKIRAVRPRQPGRGGRVADCTGLENRHVREGIVSSNLTLSAFPSAQPDGKESSRAKKIAIR